MLVIDMLETKVINIVKNQLNRDNAIVIYLNAIVNPKILVLIVSEMQLEEIDKIKSFLSALSEDPIVLKVYDVNDASNSVGDINLYYHLILESSLCILNKKTFSKFLIFRQNMRILDLKYILGEERYNLLSLIAVNKSQTNYQNTSNHKINLSSDLKGICVVINRIIDKEPIFEGFPCNMLSEFTNKLGSTHISILISDLLQIIVTMKNYLERFA